MDGLHVVWVGDCNALRTACVEDLEVSGGWVAVARDDAALQRRLAASSQRLDAAIVDARDATDPVSPSLALLRAHSPGAVMVVLSPQPDAVEDVVSDAVVIGPPHDTLRVLSAARKGTGRGDERRRHAEVVTALQQVLSATGFRALTRQHRAVTVMRFLGLTYKEMSLALSIQESSVRSYLSEAQERLGWRSLDEGARDLLRELAGDLVPVLADVLGDAGLAARIGEITEAPQAPQPLRTDGSKPRGSK